MGNPIHKSQETTLGRYAKYSCPIYEICLTIAEYNQKSTVKYDHGFHIYKQEKGKNNFYDHI